MFRKNKKNDSFSGEEIIVATSKSEKIIKKLKQRKDKSIKDIKIVNYPKRDLMDYKVGNFTFYDSDPQNECSTDDSYIEEVKNSERSKAKRKDLSSFFEASKRYNSMMQEKDTKENIKPRKQKNIESDTSRIDNDYAYVFRNVKYTKVEDFIKYLDIHYLDIENISKEALRDEKFLLWISKKSNVFEDSVKQFKEIKEKIEKK
jgi:hypothetical protein